MVPFKWLWYRYRTRAKEQIEAFVWQFLQPWATQAPSNSLPYTDHRRIGNGTLFHERCKMRSEKSSVQTSTKNSRCRACRLCVDLYLGRGIVLWAGRLYHTSDDGIIKPLSMRQLLQHWQQAQLDGRRKTSRSCVASSLRQWKRYEQREGLIIEQDNAPCAGSGDFLGSWTRHRL